MTRANYRQVLLATGLAFCAGRTLAVNPAAATHPVGGASEQLLGQSAPGSG